MSETATTPFRLFIARIAAVFSIAALALFLGHPTARAQDAAGGEDEVIFDEEDVAADEAAASADEEIVAEDEGGFLDTLGNLFGGIKDAAVGAYETATDFLGFGDEEVEAPVEEAEAPAAPLPATAVVPEDTDVEAPAAAPETTSFTLRVSIAARDVAGVLANAGSEDVIRYEPRSFEIPDRGLLTLRASQDGPLFCLAFDLSDFRVAAALADVSFEVNGARNVAEPSSAEAPAGKEGVNTACVGLPSLSATAPLLIEAVFK